MGGSGGCDWVREVVGLGEGLRERERVDVGGRRGGGIGVRYMGVLEEVGSQC